MSGTQQNLVLDDATALLALPDVAAVAPVVGGSAQIKYLNRNTRTQVLGTSMTYLPIRAFAIGRGRAFTEQEVEGGSRVALIGSATASSLFDQAEPLEERIKINGINFRVVGVLQSKGDQGWSNPDDQVIIPYTVAMKQILGTTFLREIDVQAASSDRLDDAQEAAMALLRRRHRLEPGAPDDVQINNQADILATASSITRTFTILLGSIAGISLMVGGIGIMNIMLVTVTERTREIGVRKAIGARERDILRQFLIESVVVSGLGGAIGAVVGIAIALLIGLSGAFPMSVQPASVVLAFGFAAGVGIFFGYYPALRAAKLDPIEALRYE
jgi:putative ABC transport system permease protein